LTVFAQVFAVGCSNETAPELPPDRANQDIVTKPQFWLEQRHGVSPERWLLDHQAASGTISPLTDVDIRKALLEASRRFSDSPRMIANRVVQLQAMLAQQGIAENALELLGDLSYPGPRKVQAEGFGARCQQYYLLRIRSQSKQRALSALKALTTGE
jgi:hypothetical protein